MLRFSRDRGEEDPDFKIKSKLIILLTDGAESVLASSENQKSQPARLRSNGFKVSLFLFRNNR